MPTNTRVFSCLGGVSLSLLLSWAGAPAPSASELIQRTGGAVALGMTVALQYCTPTAATHFGPSSQTLSALLGPSLAAAIHQGRDQAYPYGCPMPKAIRRTLAPFFPRAILEKVRYSTDWGAAAVGTLDHFLLGTGAVEAVTFADVIVFRDARCAGNPLLWAHELVHVEQYHRLGVEAFATQYLQQPWVIEQEAIAKAGAIKGKLVR